MKLVLASIALLVGLQSKPPAPAERGWVFGDLKLLPGYVAAPPDSLNGSWTISKKDGVTIRYQGGNVANVVHDWVQDATRDGNVAWAREQDVHGRKAKVAATKDGRMLIHIAPFNFEAKVETIEQATDLLLMVLSYGAGDEREGRHAR